MSDLKRLLNAIKKKYSIADDAKRESLNIILHGNPDQGKLVRGYFGIWGIDKVTLGYPVGKIILLWGNHSSCKTTTCIHIAAEAQKVCRYCNKNLDMFCSCDKKERKRILYVDSEDKFDSDWFSFHGVDLSQDDFITLCPGEGFETAGDIIRDFVESGQIDLIIIDTWEDLAPEKEIDESLSEYNVGLKARQGNKFMRGWPSMIQRVKKKFGISPTLFIVNQKRSSMSLYSGDVKPGGLSLDFAPSLILRYRSRTEKKRTKDGEKFIDKITYNVYIEKSKVCPEGRICTFDMYINGNDMHDSGELDNASYLFDDLLEYGFIHVDSKRNVLFIDEFAKLAKDLYNYDLKLKFNTRKECILYLKSNYSFFIVCREILIWQRRSLESMLEEKALKGQGKSHKSKKKD